MLEIDGPYDVGVSYFRSETLGNQCTAIYPIDHGQDLQEAPYLNGAGEIEGRRRISQASDGWFYLPTWLKIKPMTRLSTGLFLKGKFASDIKKVRPIIFSHGLTASNYSYTGLARELAAHGYMVILPQHQDGSCTYTKTKEGKEIYGKWPAPDGWHDKPLRSKQLNIRVSEITALVEEFRNMTPELHLSIFGLENADVKIDMNELVLSGHSFGGITAVTTGSPLKTQPKAVVVYDPWFFPNCELW